MKKFLSYAFLIFFLIALPLYFLLFQDKESMAVFMGVFFLVVSGLKLLDWKGFVHAFSMYDIVAKRIKAYAWAYPLIELGLGIAFLLGANAKILAIIVLVLFGIGIIGVAQNVFGKKKMKCACLGTKLDIPLTTITFFEDLVMIAMAVRMIWF